MRVRLPEEGSAAVRTQNALGEGVTVVSGFHNVAAHKLATDQDVGCDVLVFGGDKAARAQVVELANAAGRSEEHTSELQSLMRISYAVFCLKQQITTSHTTSST